MLVPPQGRNFHCPHVDQLCFHQSSRHFSSKVVTRPSTRAIVSVDFDNEGKPKQGLESNILDQSSRVCTLNQLISPTRNPDLHQQLYLWSSFCQHKQVFRYLWIFGFLSILQLGSCCFGSNQPKFGSLGH